MLTLAAVAGGVFIATLDLQAKNQASAPFPILFLESWADVVPTDMWVSQAVYAAVVVASLPFWGKLSDAYGRRGPWLAGMLLFMAGSAGIGTIEEVFPAQFPVSGFVQALGAGGIVVVGRALIGDLYPPSERAKRHGVLAAALGLGLFGEPTIRHLLWQLAPANETLGDFVLPDFSVVRPWPLYVNLPVGGLAVLASWLGLRGMAWTARSSIDVRGAGALLAAAILLLMPFELAGSRADGAFPWLSAQVAALIVGAVVMLIVLVVVQRRTPDPMLNLDLLSNRTFLIAVLLGVVISVTLANAQYFGAFFYPQGVGNPFHDSNPLRFPGQVAAGLAFAGSAVAAGQVMGRTGRAKRPILAFLLVGVAGAVLLSRLNSQATAGDLALGMAVTGLSLGGLTALLITVVQNAHPDRNLGEVTAAFGFIGALGAALTKPLFDWLARVPYVDALDRLGTSARTLQDAMDTYAAQQDAVRVVFAVTAVILAIGFVIALLLPEGRVREPTNIDADDTREASPASGGSHVPAS